MKTLSTTLFISAIGLAFVLASPAEAAKSSKHKNQSAAHAKKPRQTAAVVAAGTGYPGGVMAGPLYNGLDYLGDDPDPNVRAFLIKNLSGRYGSSF